MEIRENYPSKNGNTGPLIQVDLGQKVVSVLRPPCVYMELYGSDT